MTYVMGRLTRHYKQEIIHGAYIREGDSFLHVKYKNELGDTRRTGSVINFITLFDKDNDFSFSLYQISPDLEFRVIIPAYYSVDNNNIILYMRTNGRLFIDQLNNQLSNSRQPVIITREPYYVELF